MKRKGFRETIESGEFVVSSEFHPPKGTDITRLIENAKAILGMVHGVNVTDNQTAVMRVSSLALCRVLYEMGHDPILQVTCRDRNRLAIQSDLLGAHILGIRNVLCLTGDFVTVGDHKEAKPVFDLESVQLLQVVNRLNSGKDMAGNDLKGVPDLFPGAAIVPEADPLDPQLLAFEKKIKAGARFFQTQAIYDPERFTEFMTYARRFDIPILAGILLLKSERMAQFVTKNIPGIRVPEPLIEELRSARGDKQKGLEIGVDIAIRTIKAVRDQCDGVHIMAVGAEENVPEIIRRAGL